jgi:hypothetical protein
MFLTSLLDNIADDTLDSRAVNNCIPQKKNTHTRGKMKYLYQLRKKERILRDGDQLLAWVKNK